ncbi:MAG: hypothetical protein U9N54_03740 [candidate division Zixibacteria bacterium]|nr:hypothetical protein [candidate division Zixibacteria bacterium]
MMNFKFPKVIFTIFFILLFTSNSQSIPRINFTVSDTTAPIASHGVFLSIYMDNFQDIIAGFQFELISSRPDLVKFDFSEDGFDSTNSIISGYDYLSVIQTNSDSSSIQITGLSDLPGTGGTNPGIYPQQGGLFLKIPFNTIDSTFGITDYTSIIEIQPRLHFADAKGTLIGLVSDTTIDTTNYLLCQEWLLDSCVLYDTINAGPDNYDYVVTDTTVDIYIDSNQVRGFDGSITIIPTILNCDNNNSGMVEISDLVCVVNYLFGDFNVLACPTMNCDTNNSGIIDISDLTYLIEYLFNNGPTP